MKNSQKVLPGLIIALASIVLILGGISLSVAEGIIPANLTSTQTPTPTNSPIWQPFTPSVYSPTPPPVLILSLTPTWTPTWSPTWTPSLPPPPTNCPMPLGWWPYVVKSGDTLDQVARYYRINVVELQRANCLLTSELLPGTLIYVPSVPTQTPWPCGRPSGWIVYFVQPGDTLYHLSLAYGIGVVDLQQANCMGNSTTLHVGQTLYVPPWAPRIPSPTIPQAFTPTPTPTFPPTPTPINTKVIIPHTAVPTDTPLFEPTDTDVPETTDTPLPTRTPLPTHTPEPPATDTFTPTCEC